MEDFTDRFLFRDIRADEADQAAEMEQICFPPHEACKPEIMRQRVAKAPDMFLVAEDVSTGRLAGLINGLPTSAPAFSDDAFTGFAMYDPDGERMFLAGVEVLPAYRHSGLAHAMMKELAEREKRKGRKEILLTCLPEKLTFYEEMGYENRGISASAWGGEVWYEMTMDLQKEEDA